MTKERKDVVLTVAGVLASLTTAYFIWRAESKQSAAQAQAAQDQAAQQAADAAAGQEQQASYLQSLASSIPSTTFTGTSNTTSVDTTATSEADHTASIGNGVTGDGTPTSGDNLLATLLQTFNNQLSQQTAAANSTATALIQPYNPPSENFDLGNVVIGYPTGTAPVLNTPVTTPIVARGTVDMPQTTLATAVQ
jgi:hypothetical protein